MAVRIVLAETGVVQLSSGGMDEGQFAELIREASSQAEV
jgi:hypothetical protein